MIQLAIAPAAHAQAVGTLTISARIESTVALMIVAPSRAADAALSIAATGQVPTSSTFELRVVAANVEGRDPVFTQFDLQPAEGVWLKLDGGRLAGSAITIRPPDRWNPSYVCEIVVSGKSDVAATDTVRLTAVGN